MAAEPSVGTGTKGTTYTVYEEGPLKEGSLFMDIFEGEQLVSKDSNGTSDPYVIYSLVRANENSIPKKSKLVKGSGKAMLEGTYGRTAVVKKTLNPVWNHEAELKIPTGEWELLMQVYDWDRVGADDFMGQVRVKLFKDGKSDEVKLELSSREGKKKDRVSGFLRLRLYYISTALLSSQGGDDNLTGAETTDPIQVAWDMADTNKDGSLSLKEIRKLMDKLNTEMGKKDLKAVFDQVDEDNSGELDFSEFQVFVELLCERKSLTALFEKFAGSADAMTTGEFRDFLEKEQGERVSVEEAESLMATAKKESYSKEFDAKAFAHYLGSARHNGAFNPKHDTVFQDMTLPLNQYWMNSSHNTYLVGDQLKGKSEVAQYQRVLEEGCRCVELDCWDGKNGEPIVYHGHTLTSKITFEDIVKAVRVSAFTASPYPVVLSLENHCGTKQQVRMAELLKEHLGDLMPPNFQGKPLPSLEELKNKILVKCGTGGAPELADLVHLASTSFEPEKEKEAWKITSFAEGAIKDLAKKRPLDIITYTNNQMARIYPAGNRVHSSNYNPSLAWAHGAQLVALNFQSRKLPMHLNQSRFRTNGNAGYVLKPENMRMGKYDPSDAAGAQVLKVRVINGFKLPKLESHDNLDPYVRVQIHGSPADDDQVFKTKGISNNGLNPEWDEEFSFRITAPDVSILMFTLMDMDKYSKDDTVAYFGAPISSLRTGYRTLDLRSTKGVPFKESTLFVHLSWA